MPFISRDFLVYFTGITDNGDVITMGKKQDKKQFPLVNKENCVIYLTRIISSCELCMDRYKKYNQETQAILDKYHSEDVISYDIYGDICDKTCNVMSYLLNLIGDCQTTSISYFKYRKQVQKLINKGIDGIQLSSLDTNTESILTEFNKLRNWQNHVPESLLISELELIEKKKMYLPRNPMSIVHYNYVTYEYFMDLYASNLDFCKNARKIIQVAKKDYALLVGESISYPRVYSDKPITLEKSEPTKMSAQIQGLKGDNH